MSGADGIGDGTIAAGIAPELIADQRREGLAGASPSQLAWRRLKRNRTALFSLFAFVFLVAACLAAPLYANHIAHRDADDQPGGSETITIDGEEQLIVGLDGIPIGPTWRGEYLLGADTSGRDVMVRLLYGGLNSLKIGLAAAVFTTLMSILVGILAGYFRGWIDSVLSFCMNVVWAFPVILLGIALGVAFATNGLQIFGAQILEAGSLWVPIAVIGFVYIPYLARPIRGEVLALREKEFVEAARAQGMGSWRIMFSEILPNVITLLIVFFPLMVANAILLEAALSFLGAGVQAPNPSWGTMIEDGVGRIITAPYLAVVPGAMLVMTVLALNFFGEGVRDALDPRAKVKLES